MNLPHLQHQDQQVRASNAGRNTKDVEFVSASLFDSTATRTDPTSSWLTLQTQRKNLLRMPHSRLTQMALDLSPEINKGMWDFLRFANPGVFHENTNPIALAATNDFINTMSSRLGSFKSSILDAIWAGIFVGGGVFTELVLDNNGTTPFTIAVLDPNTASFRRQVHPIGGQFWELGQYQDNVFVSMHDNPCIKYLGFDKLPDNPYGRPIVGPSVYASLFLLGLIQDLRRIIANQGLSRIDYEVDAEELLNLLDRNPEIGTDDASISQFINEQLNKVKSALEGLDVDQDYIHTSMVKVNYGSTPVQTNLSGIEKLIEILLKQIVNGMKGISLLSNVLNSSTESQAVVQLEYYVSAIQSMQDEISGVLSDFFDIANRVQGISGESTYTFKRQRTADKKTVAETEEIRTNSIISQYEADLIDKEEAREKLDSITDSLAVA